MSVMTLSRVILLTCALSCFSGATTRYPELANHGETFSFVINADPQIGPGDSLHENERHLQQLLDAFVGEVNAMTPAPAFVLFNGDLVAFPREPYFASFTETARALTPPIMLVHGNHDGRYPDTQFFDSQETLSGFRKAYYAFDCGRWRFIILPCHNFLPDNAFMEELMPWLDKELATHPGRPVMVFLHYHLLPTGLTQSEYYTLPFTMKTALINTLTHHDNVRYVISGHVHAGIQSSIKTSWHYKGVDFIVAPSPVPPRNFGEEYPVFLEDGTRDEGYYLVAHISGDEAHFTGRKIGHAAQFTYPDAYPEFTEALDARALRQISALEPNDVLRNGAFEAGLEGWLRPHRYQTDQAPGYIARVDNAHSRQGDQSAYLYVHEKGHGWAYDESIEIFQMVALPPGSTPVFRCSYYTPRETKSYFGGGYIRLTGYRDNTPMCEFVFHWGARESRVRHLPQVWSYHDRGRATGLPGFHNRAANKEILFWATPDYPYRWHDMEIDLAYLHDLAHDVPGAFKALGLEKLLATCGVWCGMESGSFSAAYFDRISVTFEGTDAAVVNDQDLRVSPRTFAAPYGGWYLDGHDK